MKGQIRKITKLLLVLPFLFVLKTAFASNNTKTETSIYSPTISNVLVPDTTVNTGYTGTSGYFSNLSLNADFIYDFTSKKIVTGEGLSLFNFANKMFTTRLELENAVGDAIGGLTVQANIKQVIGNMKGVWLLQYIVPNIGIFVGTDFLHSLKFHWGVILTIIKIPLS